MNVAVDLEKYISSSEVKKMIWKIVYDDVLSHLRRIVEPWHPEHEDDCGCRTILIYPAYVDQYRDNLYPDCPEDEFHHGKHSCRDGDCQNCQLCFGCYYNWQDYERADY